MRVFVGVLVFAIGLGTLAQAQDSRRPSREDMRKKFMEKFDKNKDGKIDEKERAAIRAEFAKRRGEVQKRPAPPAEAKRPSREDMRKKFMEKFDKNKDGKIDDREKAAIRAEFAKRRGGDDDDDDDEDDDDGHRAHHKHGDRDRHGHGHHKKPQSKECPKAKSHPAKKPGAKSHHGRSHGHSEWDKRRAEWDKRRDEMRKKFMDKYDRNKDGKIDDREKAAIRAEFSKRFEEHRAEFQRKVGGHIMVELDKNDDGKLNVDEVPEKLREHFGEADRNNDGYIDKAELTRALEKAGEEMRARMKERAEEHRKHRR